MLFDVKTLVSFCSQGTTLEAGSIIMTGTPEGKPDLSLFTMTNPWVGVGYAMKEPQFLKAGDEVEIYIQNIGTLKHSISFE